MDDINYYEKINKYYSYIKYDSSFNCNYKNIILESLKLLLLILKYNNNKEFDEFYHKYVKLQLEYKNSTDYINKYSTLLYEERYYHINKKIFSDIILNEIFNYN